jgi:hypothetical protein
MMAELLLNESTSWTSGLAGSVNWILVFAVTNLYGMMIEKLGPIFGGRCILGIVIIAFILVVSEMTWKALEEIQLVPRRT